MAKKIKNRKDRECVYCKYKNREQKNEKLVMIAIDRPYKNVWFHKSCLEEIGTKKLSKFLQDSIEIWYN